jgi:hypothetical protein
MCGATALRRVAGLSVLFLLSAGSVGCSGGNTKASGIGMSDGGDAGEPSDQKPDAATGGDKPAEKDAGTEPSTGCAGKTCKAPAKCSTDGKPHCACPDGYNDVKGDGSQCDDRDECAADDKSPCDKYATCVNTPGSFECKCEAPGYKKGDGQHCDCSEGFTRNSDGLCLANDGQKCGDNLDCVNSHCEGGTCCAQRCGEPGECHNDKGATCEDGKTCKYQPAADGSKCDDSRACTADGSCQQGVCMPGSVATNCDDNNPCTDDSCEEPVGCKNKNNSAACDDKNPCTDADHCQAGSCQGGMPKDCSSTSDACNVGECDATSGACHKTVRLTSTSCSDGDACTSNDQCMAGLCKGDNACGPNALTCTAGTTNTCTCKSGFVDNAAGACVPTTNECAAANACSPDATCFDPSSTAGDVTCTCKPGFSGNGTTCTAVDPCANNPCGAGRGTCTAGSAGAHTCACSTGYVAMGGTCVCDMSGMFAARTRLDSSWTKLSDQIEDGKDTSYAYSLERHTVDADGNMTIELIACGSTSIDICGLGAAPVLAAETYAQFLPVSIFNTPTMPIVKTSVNVAKALPGSPFVTPAVAALTGITLTDPSGTWPTGRKDVAGAPGFDGSAVNGAAWIDHDNDTFVGLTSYAVPPGGIKADGVAPDPIKDFGALSAVCPRMGGAHTPYAYWPTPPEGVSLTPVRIKRFYTASRVISGYSGKIDSCDQISGDLTGPNNGKVQLDGRIGGCVRTNGSSETACPASVIDFLDAAASSQGNVNGSFKVKRILNPAEATCAMVRATNFD